MTMTGCYKDTETPSVVTPYSSCSP